MAEYIFSETRLRGRVDQEVLDKSVVEPITRCKDCKFYYEHSAEDMTYCTPRKVHGMYAKTEPNGFCAWAEPKVVE